VPVDHRRLPTLVPQQQLDGADVETTFEQMRGETVSEGMTADAGPQPGLLRRVGDGAGQEAGVDVVRAKVACHGIARQVPRAEDILPVPFQRGSPKLGARAPGSGTQPVPLTRSRSCWAWRKSS
jgi:hypothetical protein